MSHADTSKKSLFSPGIPHVYLRKSHHMTSAATLENVYTFEAIIVLNWSLQIWVTFVRTFFNQVYLEQPQLIV